jgi:PAS domain S-box-containing protein
MNNSPHVGPVRLGERLPAVCGAFAALAGGLVLAGWLGGGNLNSASPLVLVALGTAVVSCALVGWTARSLALSDRERRAAEGARRQGEERLRLLVDATPNGLVMVDRRGNVVLANARMAEMFLYGAGELIGQPIEVLVPQHLRASHPRLRDGFFAAPQVREMGRSRDLFGVRKDGSEFPVEIGLRPIRMGGEVYVLASVIDVSERKRAETLLRDSDRQLRLITDHAPVYLAHCDRERRYRFVNKAYAERFGLSPQEIVGKPIPEVLGREAYERFRHHVDAVLAGQAPEFDVEIPYPGRGARWMHAAYVPERDEAGAVVGWVAVITDVTRRKQAEDALRQSEERFSRFMRHLPGLAWIKDARGRYVYANEAAEQAFGVPSAALYGKTDDDVFPPETAAQFKRNDALVLTSGHHSQMIETLEHDDGSVRHSIVRKFPIAGAGGETALIGGIAFDLTDRMRAEQALRESEARFRQLADAMPQIVWAARPDGYLDYYNRKWYELTGAAQGETGDQSWLPILHPDDRQKCLDIWYKAVRTGEPYEIEYRFKFPATGEYRWHLGRALPVRDPEGRVVRWFGTCTDIDDRKRAEAALKALTATLEMRIAERTADARLRAGEAEQALEALARANAELTRSNAELEQFAYVASHDLQEPLRMVGSYVQLLSERYKGRLDERADKYIGYAVDGATRMQALVQDLLAYSRVGRKGATFTVVDTRAVVDRAVTDLRLAIDQSGAVVSRDDLPPVRGDERQLAQLFQNLIGNAVKFCKGRAPRVHVGAAARGDEWLFAVRDNGIGVAPEHGERIFAIFQRLHTRAEYPGTGIGLAICRKVVESHGGRIWVESRSGEGSAFYFTLPRPRGERP